MKNRKGFTLIEMMVSVGIILIFSTALVVSVSDYINKAKLVSANSAAHQNKYEIAKGEIENLAAINTHSSSPGATGSENESEDPGSTATGTPTPLPTPTPTPAPTYVFSELDANDLTSDGIIKVGSWTFNDLGIYSRGSLLFIPNNNSEYTITTKAIVDSGSTNGGYGVFFETSVNTSNKKDTGYALQFDRQLDQIVIRPRSNGKESAPIIAVGPTSYTKIPVNRSDAWWSSEHEIEIRVTDPKTTDDKKSVTVFIDADKIIDNFTISSKVDPENNYTGFRTWTSDSGVTFEVMNIE